MLAITNDEELIDHSHERVYKEIKEKSRKLEI